MTECPADFGAGRPLGAGKGRAERPEAERPEHRPRRRVVNRPDRTAGSNGVRLQVLREIAAAHRKLPRRGKDARLQWGRNFQGTISQGAIRGTRYREDDMLREAFSERLKQAMRARDARTVSSVRMILAALKDRDIAARGTGNTEGIADAEILRLLQGMIKQRRKWIVLYRQGNRPELAEQEEQEIAVIESFLPTQMSDEAIAAAAREAIAATGAASMKDMGKVMGVFWRRGDYPGARQAFSSAVLTRRYWRRRIPMPNRCWPRGSSSSATCHSSPVARRRRTPLPREPGDLRPHGRHHRPRERAQQSRRGLPAHGSLG